jgi:hypothetical protein
MDCRRGTKNGGGCLRDGWGECERVGNRVTPLLLIYYTLLTTYNERDWNSSMIKCEAVNTDKEKIDINVRVKTNDTRHNKSLLYQFGIMMRISRR